MKQLRTKKRRINSKKGISMVLAIALVAVLFLSTTTFLSIAMLQQNETGTSMNSRQAYVSSKSALDIAEDFLNDGKLNLPTNIGDSKYYVFYYDASGNVQVKDFSNASDAQNFIDNTNFTVIGNAYVKITKTSDTEYTITAVGSESKYNNTNGGNTGDISAKFEVTKHWEKKEVSTSLRMSEKKFSTPPAASSTGFFMLGDQTAFSLVRSAESKFIGGGQNNLYRTLSRSSTQNQNIFYTLQVEADSAPVTSFFPLVFDKTVQIDSDNGSRCSYTAYNNGIYLLGNSPSNGINMDYPDADDIALYTKDNAYGATLACKFLVIGGNLLSKTSSGCQSLTLKYAGDNFSRDGGIVIYFTKQVYCKNYSNGKTVTYNQGYYYLPIADNTNGVDLFEESTYNLLKDNEITDFSNDKHYKNLNGIDKYSSMLDSSGNLKNMHSAFEENAIGAKPTCFLGGSGEFQTDNGFITTNTAKTSKPTTVNNQPFTDWDDYYTYCSPSAMPTPTAPSYIDLYAGKEFNYLWYNIDQMTVNKNVNINIRSSNVVLSIGPEQGEEIYYNECYNNNKAVKNQLTAPSNFLTSGNVASVTTSTVTSRKINTIKQTDPDSSFSVMPYWGEDSFTLTVINDITVETANGNTYTVKAGKYTDIPKEGLNLFDDKAKDYFDSHSTEQEDSDSSGIDWVQSGTINTSVADSKLNQSSSVIKFEASNGGTLKNGAYTAKAIYCDFGNTVKGNNATLKGDAISIGANKLDGSGANNGLFINTYGGYSDSICELITKTTITKTDGTTEIQTNKTPVDGSLLHITRDTELVLDDGLTYSLNEGYYYFPDEKSGFNILSSAFWQKWTATNPYYYAKEINKDNTISYSIHNELKTDKVSFEGKYF